MSALAFTVMPTKETALCCVRARDSLGRPPIGFCGPDCVRRMARLHLRDYHSALRAPHPQPGRPIYVDEWASWEPWSSEWDDPTAEQVVG